MKGTLPSIASRAETHTQTILDLSETLTFIIPRVETNSDVLQVKGTLSYITSRAETQ